MHSKVKHLASCCPFIILILNFPMLSNSWMWFSKTLLCFLVEAFCCSFREGPLGLLFRWTQLCPCCYRHVVTLISQENYVSRISIYLGLQTKPSILSTCTDQILKKTKTLCFVQNHMEKECKYIKQPCKMLQNQKRPTKAINNTTSCKGTSRCPRI